MFEPMHSEFSINFSSVGDRIFEPMHNSIKLEKDKEYENKYYNNIIIDMTQKRKRGVPSEILVSNLKLPKVLRQYWAMHTKMTSKSQRYFLLQLTSMYTALYNCLLY